jgi:hypothetical protein
VKPVTTSKSPSSDEEIWKALGDEPAFKALGVSFLPPPPILYHYTSMAALLSIVKTGRIRATHFRYLNDSSEVTTMLDAVRERLTERIHQAASADKVRELRQLADVMKTPKLINEFVASFSEHGDDLSQWRSYCHDGGVSLGFAAGALRSQWVSDPSGGKSSWVGGSLVKVRYLGGEVVDDLDSIIDNTLELGRALDGKEGFFGKIERIDAARALLTLLAPSYKHHAFRHECEWRMILAKPHKPMPGQRFRVGASTLVPYIEVDLNRDLEFKLSEKYMLNKVVIGPTPNPQLSKDAIQNLFAAKGHPEVVVEVSSIPYRDW